MAAKATKTKKSFAAAAQNKLARIARMLGVSIAEIKTLAKRTESTFRSVGRARPHQDGRTVIYADERIPIVFTGRKHVVKSRAMTKDPVDCAIAKCAKDPDACWLGAFATSVHVGNATVTFWSELCPHLVVKSMLPTPLRDAIRDWDEQVKKKQKNRRFRLADGTYFLGPYPPSLDHTQKKRKPKNVGSRGKNLVRPTRRLTVRSDISLAAAAKVAAHPPKRYAAKRAPKKSA